MIRTPLLIFRQFGSFLKTQAQFNSSVIDSRVDLLRKIEKDLQKHEQDYTQLRSQFIMLLGQNVYKKNQDELLTTTLGALSRYTYFRMSRSEMTVVNKILTNNMHLQSQEALNNWLLFVLKSDEQAFSSLVHIEFLKFYVGSKLQVWRAKFGVDLQTQSLLQAVKSFATAVVHRGYLPRAPSYSRSLEPLDSIRTLELSIVNPTMKDSAIIKKIYLQQFVRIRKFFVKEMHQNLYNPKKLVLLRMLKKMSLALTCSLKSIEGENACLRELFFKLYLSIGSNAPLDQLLVGVIDFYRLSQQFPEEQGILWLDFLTAVRQNFSRLEEETSFTTNSILQAFSFRQFMLICSTQGLLNAKSKENLLTYFEENLSSYSPLLFDENFEKFICLLPHLKKKIFPKKLCVHLSLKKLIELAEKSKFATAQQSILKEVFRETLRRDYDQISGKEIIDFIKLVLVGENKTQIIEESMTLRIFILRYVSDKHKEMEWSEYQTILEYFCTHNCFQMSFDDKKNNYNKTIFEELRLWNQANKHRLNQYLKQKLRI